MDELRWIVGLNIVLAIWLGMLADTWKGRRLYVWMAIGFFTSVVGVVLLAYLPKIVRQKTPVRIAVDYSLADGYAREPGSPSFGIR